MLIPGAKTAAPILSFRKEVPRVIAGPEMAPARCLSRLPATRGSKITGTEAVFGFFGPSRRTVRSPAFRPTSAGSSRSSP